MLNCPAVTTAALTLPKVLIKPVALIVPVFNSVADTLPDTFRLAPLISLANTLPAVLNEPAVTAPAIPAPPATIKAPVPVVVDAVVLTRVKLPALIGS